MTPEHLWHLMSTVIWQKAARQRRLAAEAVGWDLEVLGDESVTFGPWRTASLVRMAQGRVQAAARSAVREVVGRLK